jgi:hypothetical protein
VVIALALLAWSSEPQRDPSLSPSQEIMWKKLDLSHAALDAIALDDFEALEAYAEDLTAMSVASARGAGDKERFFEMSREFQATARELGRAARDRDSEAAVLAYVHLTLQCLGCHRQLGERPR